MTLFARLPLISIGGFVNADSTTIVPDEDGLEGKTGIPHFPGRLRNIR